MSLYSMVSAPVVEGSLCKKLTKYYDGDINLLGFLYQFILFGKYFVFHDGVPPLDITVPC